MLRTPLLAVFCLGTTVSFAAVPVDLLLGHFEIQIGYGEVAGAPDDGWEFSVSFDADNDFNDQDGITRLDPSAVRLIAAPVTQTMINSTVRSTSPGLGEIGDPLWILPQGNVPAALFLGIRTVIAPGIFQSSVNGFYSPSSLGNIVLQMTDVDGTGPQNGGGFASWESKALGSLEFHFDSSDGINNQDRLEPVPVGSHTHYNWGMTAPGSYEVTFRATGRINPFRINPNQNTLGEATFTFVVPFSGWAETEADLRISDDNAIPVAVFRADEACEYAPNRVALLTAATEHAGVPVPMAFRLHLDAAADAAANRVGIEGADPVALGATVAVAATPLEMVDAVGPGVVTLADAATTQPLLTFSEDGIYRVTLRSRLQAEGSGALILGEPFTLVFLAGLPVDYSYAEFADSFERQHGLASGALTDPMADRDRDGVPNGVEYQLFWHGFDPVLADAGKLPLPEFEDGTWGIRFLRDTYKDDFALNAISLAARFSADLVDWEGWHTADSSQPDAAVFENGVGAESIGRVMERRLVADDATSRGFFRFEVF